MIGDASNVAARVQTVGEPGSVLVTINVLRQIPGLFVAEECIVRDLVGLSAPVNLFRIVRASGGRRRAAARAPTPFVGREPELRLMARRWERVQAGEGQLVLIVGEPGIGKTRLVAEFRAKLAETSHTWAEWSALQLLQNTPLHPIAEWGRMRFGVEAPAEQRLADLENTLGLIGLDPAEYAPLLAPIVDIPLPAGRAADMAPAELRRRQLEAIVAWFVAGARSQVIALVFEDLQWADPTSLDLLQRLAERGAQARLLIIATARQEFRPPWSLRTHHSVISLSPLDRAQVRQIVGELASRQALSREVVERVSERTGGVPLFVEEVTRLLLERGEADGFEWKPLTLKACILPAITDDISSMLDILVQHRFIRSFDVGGKTYGVVRNFVKFQRPKQPKDTHPGTDEMRTYAGFVNGKRPRSETGRPPLVHGSEVDGDEPPRSSEPVPNWFVTGSGITRQMEEGGGRRRRNGESSLTVVTPSSVREGTTTTTSGTDVQPLAQLEAECRTLVGAHPVATNVNFRPIAALVGQGASHSDVLGGIRAAT